MKTISAEAVDQAWQKLSNYSVKQGEKLAQKFIDEQPAMVAYLLAVDTGVLDADEREMLFYLGTVIWQLMRQEGALAALSEEAIIAAEEANQEMLEPLAAMTDGDAEQSIGAILTDYAQPALLRFVIESLMDAAQDGDVRQDNLGMMMIDLKTVIDCFDREEV